MADILARLAAAQAEVLDDSIAEALADAHDEVTRLRDALNGLLNWSAITGGWDAPCWDRARAAFLGHHDAPEEEEDDTDEDRLGYGPEPAETPHCQPSNPDECPVCRGGRCRGEPS
jgi:hypothetical protein